MQCSNIVFSMLFKCNILHIFRDIVFGPPGRSKGALLFLLGNLLCWGYPVYFFFVSTFYNDICANLAYTVLATVAVMVYSQRLNARAVTPIVPAKTVSNCP